jgi:hypothetical protein
MCAIKHVRIPVITLKSLYLQCIDNIKGQTGVMGERYPKKCIPSSVNLLQCYSPFRVLVSSVVKVFLDVIQTNCRAHWGGSDHQGTTQKYVNKCLYLERNSSSSLSQYVSDVAHCRPLIVQLSGCEPIVPHTSQIHGKPGTHISSLSIPVITYAEGRYLLNTGSKTGGRDSAVGITTDLGMDGRGVRVRVPVRVRLFSSPRHPDRCWGQLSLPSNGNRG